LRFWFSSWSWSSVTSGFGKRARWSGC